MARPIPPVLLLLPLIGSCSGTPPVRHIDYQCDNGYRMRVDLSEDRARVILHDRTLELPRQPRMKGERYLSKDRQNLFLRKGKSAVLAVSAGHGMLRCTESKTNP
jgi:membrane-bound inhibitor of C-type lysozyme